MERGRAVTQGDGRARELIAAARAAMANAYAPYSRFRVGAAVRLIDGGVITGANFENASYGLSLCAETVAIAAANAQGRIQDIEAIAVAGGESGVAPCGRCRQILNEAEQLAGRLIAIYCAAAQGNAISEHRVADLLPHAFGPRDLHPHPYGKN